MSAVLDISDTVLAKSDQLNAVDLPPNNLRVTVSHVEKVRSDQPVNIHLVGFEGRPYKPCLSMRRVLMQVWGTDASQWAGRSMALYCDMSVTWAGKEVGGIRVSHVSHINQPFTVPIQKSKTKREMYTVGVLQQTTIEDANKRIEAAQSNDDVSAIVKQLQTEMNRDNFSQLKDAVVKKRASFTEE